ncbi:hypothetical protein [Aminobacter carboxidus]|uniref:Uncharacterized protein n=1 Tax=Aminobacter carboxidus TaxID=376165 RepID=A0A8E2BCC6_9HYPH|nr:MULTISPECIES: hypothetical protein [Aminobacter carboxidus group]MBB6467451.1 hypothetical protein [Aminobacter lissarensis]MBE1206440.1 hypothetical protein [Aminobacter carboxidus]
MAKLDWKFADRIEQTPESLLVCPRSLPCEAPLREFLASLYVTTTRALSGNPLASSKVRLAL